MSMNRLTGSAELLTGDLKAARRGRGLHHPQIEKRIGPEVDIAHIFVDRRGELHRHLAALRGKLRPDAAIWVSWPKKAAKVPTDITEDTIREVALPLGFVDIKVCAVSGVWSGLKLVLRKELR